MDQTVAHFLIVGIVAGIVGVIIGTGLGYAIGFNCGEESAEDAMCALAEAAQARAKPPNCGSGATPAPPRLIELRLRSHE